MRLVFIFVLLACASLGRADDPFTVTARLDRAEAAWRVVVQVDVPPRHDLYADERFAVQVNGKALPGRITPAPALQPGADGQPEQVFTSRVEAVYALDAVRGPVAVRVSWQGCSDTSCFPPGTTTFVLTPAGEVAREVAPRAAVMPSGAVSWTAGIQIENSAAGYLGSRAFLDFLASSGGGEPGAPQGWSRQFLADPAAFLSRHGMAWTLLLMLLGGLLLNLTPCVLPMIPINLAIIGAGARAGSRRRGLALGAAYGAGIALVYGALGVAVVLSGSVFGTLQSSPVFNGIMAVIFLALALAMVDVIPIDLARFQRGGGSGGGILTAGVAGGVSALLAGACVAPVVAAVLLLAGSMYHAGSSAALLLPFMLGLGMALPWPFAGAGMAVLPRPGAWMLRVKYGFGVLIAIMGIYYGWLAYTGFAARTPAATAGNELRAGDLAGWTKWLAAAKAEHKPLLLDFHASWCKNCHAMDRTTFRDSAVRRALEKFIVVRVAAERPGEEPARGMCQAFGVLGLPTYVVVQVKDL